MRCSLASAGFAWTLEIRAFSAAACLRVRRYGVVIETIASLWRLGVDCAQGFYLGAPAPLRGPLRRFTWARPGVA